MDTFTPTEKRMLQVLSDGNRHTREELHACLYDRDAPLENIQAHISKLRVKLRPKGQDIVCELYTRRTYYRHIRLLVSATDGKRG